MTFDDAVELVKQWPKDRSVPRKLKAGIDGAKGFDKVLMGNLVEALTVASTSKADFELIETYFD